MSIKALIEGLMRIAPDLVAELIARLQGGDAQSRADMIEEMHARVTAMRAEIDAQIDERFGDEPA